MTYAVSVADLEAATRVGTPKNSVCELTTRIPRTEYPAVNILEGGGLAVELIERATSATRNREDGLGLMKVGIVVEDFDNTIATLRERGVAIPFGPYPARQGQKANAMIRDNEGNLTQFVSAR
jgi:hypothetical protein